MLNNGHHINLFYENRLFFSKKNKKRPAIFLDRDGVLIKEKHYISNIKDIELEYGIEEVFKLANSLDIPIIIVTNQSGIARGFLKWDDYLNITEEMINFLNKDNTLLAIYANGLNANAPTNSWRKPNPSMILNAAFTLDIDLSKSLLIGDRLTDLISGEKAGIKHLMHVRTGHGIKERKKIETYFSENNCNDEIELKLIDKFNKDSIAYIQKYFAN